MKKKVIGQNFFHLFCSPKKFLLPCWLSIGLIFMVLSGCRQSHGNEPALVKLYGNGNAGNFSRNFILYTNRCHPAQPGALMAAPGDMLWLENWILLNEAPFKDTDGAIHFIESDSVLLLNGKPAGIRIDSSYNLSHLVDLNDKKQVSDLKVIALTAEGLLKYRTEIEKIASINPGAVLMVSGKINDADLEWLLSLFAPTTLSIELDEAQQQLLAGEQQLKTLHISYNDSMFHCTPLPAMKNLQQLFFMFDADEIASSPENKNWLKTNPQVKTLILTDWGEKYPAGLLQNLEAPEVLIMGGMDIPPAEIMAHSQTLKRVIIDSPELQLQLPLVNDLVAFDTKNTADFIGQVTEMKPGCKNLEIFAESNPLDISPLGSLRQLEALTLVDADSIPIAPLMNMKQLKLLSYSTDSTNMDSTLAVLQSALPDTVVVANEGLCLGSGWLMALVPALLAAMGLAVYRKKLF